MPRARLFRRGQQADGKDLLVNRLARLCYVGFAMKYTILILSLGLLPVCGCIADGQENMFKRESSSRWYNDADAFENNTSGFTL